MLYIRGLVEKDFVLAKLEQNNKNISHCRAWVLTLDYIARVFRQELFPEITEEIDDPLHPRNGQVR